MTHKKNNLYSVLAILAIGFLFSCTKEIEYENEPIDNTLTKSALPDQKIRVEDVIKALAQQSSMDVCEEEVRNMLSYRYPHKNISKIKAISEEGLPVFYQVAFDQGYALVSADKRTEPIIAFSEEESFSYEECDNSAFLSWLKGEINTITAIKKENPKVENENTKYWSTFGNRIQVYKFRDINQQPAKTKSSVIEDIHWARVKLNSVLCDFDGIVIPHLISTEWGQGFPWNACTPMGCPTGTTAVAIGQLLHYLCVSKGMSIPLYNILNHPVTLIAEGVRQIDSLTTVPVWEEYKMPIPTGAPHNNPTAMWNSMAQYYNDSNTDIVAHLLAEIGSYLEQSYFYIHGSLPSGITSIDNNQIHNIFYTLSHYNVSASYAAFNSSAMQSSLNGGYPVLQSSALSGYSNPMDRLLVESWLLDGMRNGDATYLSEYMWLKIYDPDHTLDEWTDQIIDKGDIGGSGGSGSIIPVHYEGEIEYILETIHEISYLANWGNDGSLDNSRVTFNSNSTLVDGQVGHGLPSMYYDFDTRN